MNRVEQISWIRNLAADIGFADIEGTPEEKVDEWLSPPDFEKPEWFNEHDRRLLIAMVKGEK